MKQRAFIFFQAHISPEMGGKFCNELEHILDEGISELFLLLNSPGGSLRLALGILNFLESLPLKITTCNMSSCDSAAMLLFLAGKQRICTPESRFWLHPVFKESPIVHTEDELKVELNCLRQDNNAVAEAIALRTDGDVSKWKEAMLSKKFISAQEALELGLAHSIEKISIGCSDRIFTVV